MSTRRERANRWWLRCPNCGAWKPRPGHYVPPSFGDPGFYICRPTQPPDGAHEGEDGA